MLWTIYALHTVSKLCDCSLLWKPIELSKPINCVFFLFQVRILIFHQVRSPNLLAISHGTNFSADVAYSSNEDENNTPRPTSPSGSERKLAYSELERQFTVATWITRFFVHECWTQADAFLLTKVSSCVTSVIIGNFQRYLLNFTWCCVESCK